MIIDLVLSLQNGYENRGLITPYIYKYNFVFKYKLKQNKHILNLINYNRNNFKTFLK